jgi:hypothetical protein
MMSRFPWQCWQYISSSSAYRDWAMIPAAAVTRHAVRLGDAEVAA